MIFDVNESLKKLDELKKQLSADDEDDEEVAHAQSNTNKFNQIQQFQASEKHSITGFADFNREQLLDRENSPLINHSTIPPNQLNDESQKSSILDAPTRNINQEAESAFNSYSRHPPRELENIIINGEEYKIIKEVGRGSSGKVFQVFSIKHSEFYALKWIELKPEDDKQTIMYEIELLRSLKEDARIVAILDYFATRYAIFIIMEFGQIDLARLLQKQLKKKWDLIFIRYYWKQMLECVDSIHHKGIVHSDLKPANFVLVKGWLKLIDFGIAKKVADDTTNIYRGIQVGTVNYMSPESLVDVNQGKDDSESLTKLGRPSDVWSLGCILYQMVYGKTPFYHLNLTHKIMCIRDPEYKISFPQTVQFEEDAAPIQIPKALLGLLESCLDRKPELRPLLSELMVHSFINDI